MGEKKRTARGLRNEATRAENRSRALEKTADELEHQIAEMGQSWRKREDEILVRGVFGFEPDCGLVREVIVEAAQLVADRANAMRDEAEQLREKAAGLYEKADRVSWVERAGGDEEAGAYLYRLSQEKGDTESFLYLWRNYGFWITGDPHSDTTPVVAHVIAAYEMVEEKCLRGAIDYIKGLRAA